MSFFCCFSVLTYILDLFYLWKNWKTTASYWKIGHSGTVHILQQWNEFDVLCVTCNLYWNDKKKNQSSQRTLTWNWMLIVASIANVGWIPAVMWTSSWKKVDDHIHLHGLLYPETSPSFEPQLLCSFQGSLFLLGTRNPGRGLPWRRLISRTSSSATRSSRPWSGISWLLQKTLLLSACIVFETRRHLCMVMEYGRWLSLCGWCFLYLCLTVVVSTGTKAGQWDGSIPSHYLW